MTLTTGFDNLFMEEVWKVATEKIPSNPRKNCFSGWVEPWLLLAINSLSDSVKSWNWIWWQGKRISLRPWLTEIKKIFTSRGLYELFPTNFTIWHWISILATLEDCPFRLTYLLSAIVAFCRWSVLPSLTVFKFVDHIIELRPWRSCSMLFSDHLLSALCLILLITRRRRERRWSGGMMMGWCVCDVCVVVVITALRVCCHNNILCLLYNIYI